MNAPLRNLFLSAGLIAVPAGGFTLAEMLVFPTAPTASPESAVGGGLGDLTAYMQIVTDTQRIAAGGDLSAAENRITDLETLWDDHASELRKVDRAAWTAVDTAADAAFSALRAKTPDPGQVTTALNNLQSVLKAPQPAAEEQPLKYVAGIAVTDETGRAVPCEDLLGQLRDALSAVAPTAAVADLQSKALERCNADDDARADSFAAQALSQVKG